MAKTFLLMVTIAVLTASSALAEEPKERGQRGPRNPEMRQRILEEFDLDGDGELNREEREAAREARRAKMGESGRRRGPGGEAGRRGPGGPGGEAGRGRRGPGGRMDPAELFGRIDADGDGTITREQFVAFMSEMRTRMGGGGRAAGGPGGRRRGGEGRPGGRPEAEPAGELN